MCILCLCVKQLNTNVTDDSLKKKGLKILKLTSLVHDIRVKQLAQPLLSVRGYVCVVCAPVPLYSSPALGHNSFIHVHF